MTELFNENQWDKEQYSYIDLLKNHREDGACTNKVTSYIHKWNWHSKSIKQQLTYSVQSVTITNSPIANSQSLTEGKQLPRFI